VQDSTDFSDLYPGKNENLFLKVYKLQSNSFKKLRKQRLFFFIYAY